MFSRLSSVTLFLSALSTLTSLTSASPVAPFDTTSELALARRQFVPLPAFDIFYRAPANLESLKPGEIIRTRKVDVQIVASRQLRASATQIVYRSTSQNGSAIWTLTTVIQPPNAQKGKLVTFLTAEDSVTSKCAPSYTYRAGASGESVIVVAESLFVAALLNAGWTVTIPDYEGPNSAFAVGRLAGRLSIDAARATLNLPELKWPSNTQVAFSGYSGGGIAAGWTAALLADYAPELNVVGVSAGGVPANVSQVLEYVDGTIFSGFGLSGVVGLVNAYAEFGPLYDKLATAAGVEAFRRGRSQCVIGNVIEFAFKKFNGPELQKLGDRILYEPTVAKIVAENVLGTVKSETPKVPTFVFHAVKDEIIPINGTDYAVQQWCKNNPNAPIDYVRDVGPSEHVSGELASLPVMINFISDRFAGKPFVKKCTIRDGHVPELRADSLGPTFEPILKIATTLFTGQVGTGDSKFKAELGKRVQNQNKSWNWGFKA